MEGRKRHRGAKSRGGKGLERARPPQCRECRAPALENFTFKCVHFGAFDIVGFFVGAKRYYRGCPCILIGYGYRLSRLCVRVTIVHHIDILEVSK